MPLPHDISPAEREPNTLRLPPTLQRPERLILFPDANGSLLVYLTFGKNALDAIALAEEKHAVATSCVPGLDF